jgi:8-oxo-dGTP pyrophosphatase MutT (NUDIX family)
VALILRDGPAGLEVLFIRRAEHPQDPWSGQMAFPGGRAEPGDADLRLTAVRETAEEIGVDLAACAQTLGALDELQAMARMRPLGLVIAPFVFGLTGSADVRLSEEVRSVHWLPLDELLSERLHSTMEYAHDSTTLQFPCLRVDGLVIWGLTYRMFMSLASLLAAALPATRAHELKTAPAR